MSTKKERQAFLLTIGAKYLRDMAAGNFHGWEFPFWPSKSDDNVKLFNDAMKLADSFEARAKRVAPDFDAEVGSE